MLFVKVTRYIRTIELKLPDSERQRYQSPHKQYAHPALQRYFQDVDLREIIRIPTAVLEQHSRQRSRIHLNQVPHP